MVRKNELKEILFSLHQTISNYDNKAIALLSAVGIVFGFSMFSLNELINRCGVIKVLTMIVGSSYLLCFVVTIALLVLIIFPRRRNREEKKRAKEYKFYSEDLYKHLKIGDICDFTSCDGEEDALVDQIMNCTRITHIKETLLRIGTIFIIIFASLLILLIMLLFITL